MEITTFINRLLQILLLCLLFTDILEIITIKSKAIQENRKVSCKIDIFFIIIDIVILFIITYVK